MRRTSLSILLLLATTGAAIAHAGERHSGLAWNFEWWVVLGLIVAAQLYMTGTRRLRMRAPDVLGRRETSAFWAGMLLLALALMSPIDTVGAELFSVHMVQHILLMLVCAPLFVLARPGIVMLWAFPPKGRRALGALFKWSGLHFLAQQLTSPLVAWVLFSAAFAFWHLPGPYGWALANEAVHVLEHVSFFVTAYAFWSVVIEPAGKRRLELGTSVIYVATAAVLSSLPGALLVLSQRPFYPEHAAGAAQWGMTLLEDQQLAGLIMWIPAGFAYMIAILLLAASMLREPRRFPGATAIVLLVAWSAAGPASADQPPAADPERGAHEIARIGCGTCHQIPGIEGASGRVGPPLTGMAERIFIAGMLRNSPDNMTAWLLDPQAIVPGNAMPNTGLTEKQARDIAAYLGTLKER